MTEEETTRRGEVVSIAMIEIGVTENPPGSNSVKYNQWFYGKDTRAAWCCTFIMWCFHEANIPFPKADWYKGYASVPNLKKARKHEITNKPQPGDIVIFEFNGKPEPDHIGIFDHWIEEGKTFKCIEGNTSSKGSQDNGGIVLNQVRSTKLVDCFINPSEYRKTF